LNAYPFSALSLSQVKKKKKKVKTTQKRKNKPVEKMTQHREKMAQPVDFENNPGGPQP